MAWGEDRKCPTCGSTEHREIQMLAIVPYEKITFTEMMFACKACGTLFDPQYAKKVKEIS